jgi:sugar phosphate isomerase/epimerase
MDVHLGHADGAVRRASVDKCLRVVERMQPVQPRAVIFHFQHEAYRNGMAAADIPRWQTALEDSVGDLLATGVAPHSLCVETLSYPFEWVEEIVFENNLSVCLDIGHILMNGYDLTEYLARYWTRTRVVHLHGVLDGHDHRDISGIDQRILDQLMERLYASGNPPVLTLEVFNEGDLVKSLQRLEEFAQ